MTLLSSFSLSYFARPSEQSGYAEVTLIRSFNATYSPLQTTPISIKTVLFNSFSVTVPELAVIEAQRDPFGLITHKKK